MYREISIYQKLGTSLSSLYKTLSVSYQPDGYLTNLKKYQAFTGQGCTASQFLTRLRSLSRDVVMADNAGSFSEGRVYQLVRDKTFTVLPSIAPIILERLTLYYGGSDDRDEMYAFMYIFMSLKDRISIALSKGPCKTINSEEEE